MAFLRRTDPTPSPRCAAAAAARCWIDGTLARGQRVPGRGQGRLVRPARSHRILTPARDRSYMGPPAGRPCCASSRAPLLSGVEIRGGLRFISLAVGVGAWGQRDERLGPRKAGVGNRLISSISCCWMACSNARRWRAINDGGSGGCMPRACSAIMCVRARKPYGVRRRYFRPAWRGCRQNPIVLPARGAVVVFVGSQIDSARRASLATDCGGSTGGGRSAGIDCGRAGRAGEVSALAGRGRVDTDRASAFRPR